MIDDGSNDNTEVVIRNLNDDRIQYYKIDSNVGRGRARNFGLSKVQTDFLAILDMDDLMLHSRLERFNISINNGFDGLITSTLLVDNQLNVRGIRNVIYNSYFNLFTHATLCIKTNILRSIMYSESRYAEDQRVILLISNTCNLDLCKDPLYVYQEEASINVRSAYLSNYYAFINLTNMFSLNFLKSIRERYMLYILRFGFNAFILFFISKICFGDLLYNKIIQNRVKQKIYNDLIVRELKLYE